MYSSLPPTASSNLDQLLASGIAIARSLSFVGSFGGTIVAISFHFQHAVAVVVLVVVFGGGPNHPQGRVERNILLGFLRLWL